MVARVTERCLAGCRNYEERVETGGADGKLVDWIRGERVLREAREMRSPELLRYEERMIRDCELCCLGDRWRVRDEEEERGERVREVREGGRVRESDGGARLACGYEVWSEFVSRRGFVGVKEAIAEKEVRSEEFGEENDGERVDEPRGRESICDDSGEERTMERIESQDRERSENAWVMWRGVEEYERSGDLERERERERGREGERERETCIA
ncbi:hypothetical protein Tco_0486783 [Tanacetum coccineum]